MGGSLCSRQGAEKEHSRHEKRNKSRKKKVSPANQKQISSLTSDIDLELKDLDKDFAQLEEANKKHKNNEHQNKRNQDRRRSTLATIENFDMGGGGFEITLENPSLEDLQDKKRKKRKIDIININEDEVPHIERVKVTIMKELSLL